MHCQGFAWVAGLITAACTASPDPQIPTCTATTSAPWEAPSAPTTRPTGTLRGCCAPLGQPGLGVSAMWQPLPCCVLPLRLGGPLFKCYLISFFV